MITIFIITFLLATLILWANPRNPSLRWISASLYAVAFNAVSYYFDLELSNDILPSPHSDASNSLINTLNFIADAATAYNFGMFSVTYSGLFSSENRRKIMIAGMVILAVVWLLTPLSSIRHINYVDQHGWPVCIFGGIQLLGGAVLLMIAYYREKNPFKKIERFLTNVLIVPTMLWAFCSSYLFFIMGFELWRYNYIAAISFLFIFSVIGLKKGILGVNIKIEQLKSQASLNVLQDSTGLINHTIKNEIGKVDILLHYLKHAIRGNPQLDQTSTTKYDDIITTANYSIQHIQSMMSKIHENVQEINVSLQKENLLPIAEDCLNSLRKTMGADISVTKNFKTVPDVYCDRVHIKEVIHNLISNALEAMDHQGEITISLSEIKTEVVLTIRDTGKGIPKDVMAKIFDPFFSTKNQKNNYGLGLFYCKNVMLKHGGSIQVESPSGKGTRFTLHFPK